MSSFIVSDETINKVMQLLAPDVLETKQADELATSLVALNCDAFALRYAHNAEACDEAFEWRQPFRTKRCNYTLAECAKAAACWMYQCNEGAFPNRMIYKMVQHAYDKVPECVKDSPEYQAADWD